MLWSAQKEASDSLMPEGFIREAYFTEDLKGLSLDR